MNDNTTGQGPKQRTVRPLPALKPCPFCGGRAEFIGYTRPTMGTRWTLVCAGKTPHVLGGCGLHFREQTTKHKVAKAWNTRA